MARDLDLCRDEDLVASAGDSTAAWTCGFCDSELDRVALEERLLSIVEAWAVEWATQDLKCERCGALRVNDFMEHCTCSGQWKEVVNREEVMKRMGVMRRVAKFYGLRMLGDVVEGMYSAL